MPHVRSLLEGPLLHTAELVIPDPQGLQLWQALQRLSVQDPDHVRAQVDGLQGRHVVQSVGNLEMK